MSETKFHCNSEIEGKRRCETKCDHCREYYKPLDTASPNHADMPSSPSKEVTSQSPDDRYRFKEGELTFLLDDFKKMDIAPEGFFPTFKEGYRLAMSRMKVDMEAPDDIAELAQKMGEDYSKIHEAEFSPRSANAGMECALEMYRHLQSRLSSMKAERDEAVRPKNIIPTGTYFVAECGECGFKGSSEEWLGGGQIADTGDYGDCYCPVCNSVELGDAEDDIYIDQREFLLKKIVQLNEKYSEIDFLLFEEKQQVQSLTTDRDLYKKESEANHHAWIEATAMLDGKNLENAQLKEEAQEYRKGIEKLLDSKDALEEHVGHLWLQSLIDDKYKKEEQK